MWIACVKEVQIISKETKDFMKKAKVIIPERTLSSPLGYRYSVAEEYFGKDARSYLDSLVEEGLMERDFYSRELGCPECKSINLIVHFHCPKCDSTKIAKKNLIEHWPCGFVGGEDEFKDEKCPKCRKTLKKAGVDYAKLGPKYKCLDCNEIFQSPVDRLKCSNCNRTFTKEEAEEVILYSYKISPKLEEELDAAIYQKNYLIQNLKEMGFEIEQSENIEGKSGLKHDFYLIASLGKGAFKTRIVIEILYGGEYGVPADEIFSLYAKVQDIETDRLILAAIPKFSEDAKKLLEHYKIVYVEGLSLHESAEAILGRLKELVESDRD